MFPSRKRVLLPLVALVAAVLLLSPAAVVGQDGSAADEVTECAGEPAQLRVGIIPFQDFYPFRFAEDQGWLDQAGLDVEFVDFQFFTDATEGLAADAVDLAPQEVAALLPVVENFPEIRFVVPVHVFDNGFALMTRPDAGLSTYDDLLLENGGDIAQAERDTAAQLDGLNVVTTGNTDMEVNVYAASKLADLDWSSVEITDMDPNAGLAAFLSGTGDLYMGGIPQRLRALSEGNQELITGSHLGRGSVPLVGFATTQEKYDQKADAMQRLFCVWNIVSRWAAESPENTEVLGATVAKLLNEKTGAQMKPSDFKTMFNGWQHFPPTVTEWKAWYDKLPPEERWDLATEFFVDVKATIAEKPEFAQYILLDEFLDDYEARYGPDM